MKQILLLSAVLLISSCATSKGFNRTALKEKLSAKTEISENQINEAQASKAKLPKPYKVGIYFQGPEIADSDRTEWSWTEADKKKIVSAVDSFKKSGEISSSFIISSAMVSGTDVKSLRQVALKQGADALIVVSAVNDLDHYTTEWGWTYIALFPALFVPASVSDILFISRAVMWDTHYDFSYLTADSEVLINRKYPAVFREDKKATLEAKEDSITGLHAELMKRINNVNLKRR